MVVMRWRLYCRGADGSGTLALRAVRAQARLDGCDTIMARLWPALNPLFQAAGLTALAAET